MRLGGRNRSRPGNWSLSKLKNLRHHDHVLDIPEDVISRQPADAQAIIRALMAQVAELKA
jgi:hypothetical protein